MLLNPQHLIEVRPSCHSGVPGIGKTALLEDLLQKHKQMSGGAGCIVDFQGASNIKALWNALCLAASVSDDEVSST